MFQIGFGLLLYHLLHWFLVALLVVFLVPFLMNIADGKGYGYNFKKVWGGIFWFLRLGVEKRK
jgi:hypothetical protein